MKNSKRIVFLTLIGFLMLGCIQGTRYKYLIVEPPAFLPSTKEREAMDWYTMAVRNRCSYQIDFEVKISFGGYSVLDSRKEYLYRTILFREGSIQEFIYFPAGQRLYMGLAVYLPEDSWSPHSSVRVPTLYYSKDSEPELIIECSGPDDVQLRYIGPDGNTYPNDEPREREDYRIAPIGQ